MASLPKFVDIEEFAEILAVSSRTVRRMKKRGEVPRVFYFGDLPRWLLSDIEEWIERRGDGPAPERVPDDTPPDPSGSAATPESNERDPACGCSGLPALRGSK